MRNRIIEIRKSHKLSQQAFADSIGVSRNFLNRYENGNREISDRTVADICRVYGISEEWLRTGEGEMNPPMSEMDLIMQRLANVNLQTMSSDENAKKDAEFKRRLASTILDLDDEACELLIQLLDKMGYEKRDD